LPRMENPPNARQEELDAALMKEALSERDNPPPEGTLQWRDWDVKQKKLRELLLEKQAEEEITTKGLIP
jgi:hypothetical protein